jgi:hypothetical protein
MGKQLRKKIACGVIAFGFVSASEMVSAQNQTSRYCQTQTRIVHDEQAGLLKNQTLLHEQLNLSGEQETHWNNFIASVPIPTKSHRPERVAMEKLTTPERLEQQLKLIREQEAKLTSNLLALKAFYGSLTPEQQKTFDEFHARTARNALS